MAVYVKETKKPAARGGAAATKAKTVAKAKTDGDLEARKMRLRELDRTARFTNWMDGAMWAGRSCYGNVTNEQWCVKEAARNIERGRWVTVKHCGPLVALFRDSIRVDRKELRDADFLLISDEVKCAFEMGKEV